MGLSVDIQRISDLEESICTAHPVVEKHPVSRHKEITQPNAVVGGACNDGDRFVADQIAVDPISSGLNDKIIFPGIGKVDHPHRRRKHHGAQVFWPVTQKIGGQGVQHAGFVDAFSGVLAEKHIAPIQQIVDIAHHDGLLIGRRPQGRDGMGIKWIVQVALDLVLVDQEVAFRGCRCERQVIPGRTDLRWVENKFVPHFGFFKLLGRIERLGNQEGSMEKELLVINAARAVEIAGLGNRDVIHTGAITRQSLQELAARVAIKLDAAGSRIKRRGFIFLLCRHTQ